MLAAEAKKKKAELKLFSLLIEMLGPINCNKRLQHTFLMHYFLPSSIFLSDNHRQDASNMDWRWRQDLPRGVTAVILALTLTS